MSIPAPPSHRTLSLKERLGSPAVWFAFLGGSVAWSAHFLISYGLVYLVCATGATGLFVLVTVVAAAVTIAAAMVSWRLWRRSEPRGGAAAIDTGARTRMFGLAGLLMNALFLLAIIFQAVAPLVLPPCEGQP